MPLRQLQRPLLRTTIAAAASTTWRPLSDQLLHGSSCCRYKNPVRRAVPDGSKTNNKDAEAAPPEPLAVPEDLQAYAQDVDDDPGYDNRAILVLSGAPKSLVESDFYRAELGGPARHVEGWSSAGIHRIIPVRDPETLEPAGQYYVLFESGAAAAAWQQEVSTLWRLARARNWTRQLLTGDEGGSTGTPQQSLSRQNLRDQDLNLKQKLRALSKTDQQHSLAGYEDLLVDEDGNEVDLDAASIRHFTLIPQSQRYDIERPVYTRLDSLLNNGAPSLVERLMAKAGSRHLVLLVLEGGRLSVPTLRALIHEDGAERNLPWRVKGLDRDFDTDVPQNNGGIMAFGKSSLKASEQGGPEESVRQQIASVMGVERGTGGTGAGEEFDNGRGLKAEPAAQLASESLSRTALERQKLKNENRRWNRFIVPFLDEAEARRFVRHWHRRQLQLRMGHEDSDVKTWEESRTINASILW
ncbi:hypothetical protein PG994_000415 [Apiospora phragmitis]|uniref:Uncharacterized protein n=1 Tax=Apiospora phragmitis TaxID=2905665 RepID=A0ABR1X692_9PEZI